MSLFAPSSPARQDTDTVDVESSLTDVSTLSEESLASTEQIIADEHSLRDSSEANLTAAKPVEEAPEANYTARLAGAK